MRRAKKTIVFTGGPNSGKTTMIKCLKRMLPGKVKVVPEAATILFAGGMPHPMSGRAVVKLQGAIYSTQLALEEMAHLEEPDYLLCDRGVADGYGFINSIKNPADYWWTLNTNQASALGRYDQVIFLSQPRPGDYSLDSNHVRKETADEADEVSRRLIEIWDYHTHFNTLSSTNFTSMLLRVEELICQPRTT